MDAYTTITGSIKLCGRRTGVGTGLIVCVGIANLQVEHS